MHTYNEFNLGRFELHAVDNCNLNCLNCNHHSLYMKKREYQAFEYFPHIDEMIRRNIKFERIYILGGEPFLHSDIINFVDQIKKRYNKNIILTTNGFWLSRDYLKYESMFKQIHLMNISIYPTLKATIDENKMLKHIEDIKSKFGLDIKLRNNIKSFIEVKFTKESEIPRNFCIAQANCTNLLAGGKLSRCGVGGYASENPSVTTEFLDTKYDMFYDLTIDDGRDFKSWKEKYPLKSCNFCSVWKNKWVPWENSKKEKVKFL